MPIDPGLGGWAAPVPVDPILIEHRPYVPPVSQPITPPDVSTTSATAYRGYYYEIAQNAAGEWLWAVYTGVQQTWGLELILVSGGTSESYDDALFQVTGIIDNLTEDPDFTPTIQEDAGIGLEGVPEAFTLLPQPADPLFTMPEPGNGDGNGNGGNGNGNGNGGAPLLEDFQFVGLLAVIGAVYLFKKQG